MSPNDTPCGILPIDKPLGITSAKALAKVRFLLTESFITKNGKSGDKKTKLKAGHSGTLDPMATGILPILIGEATKYIPYLAARKTYCAEITFGIQTNTDDAEGEVIRQNAPPLDIAAVVRDILPKFCGEISQAAPAHSALKYRGKPLYYYARRGISTPTKTRQVQVHQVKILSAQDNKIELQIECDGGFYVRSLARDLGTAIGCGAHLSALRRTLSAGLTLGMQLNELESTSPLERMHYLLPIESALMHIPAQDISEATAHQFATAKKITDGETLRLMVAEKFAGLGCKMEGGTICGKKMLSWTHCR